MRMIFKQTGAIFLTLILSVAAFAAPAENITADGFQATALLTADNSQNGQIPPSVLETNFRWWQPSQPVPTYSSYARNDIAWTDGSVIYYNPSITSQVPPKVAAFFLAHEYGHIYGRTANEYLADQFAARVYAQTDISVVKAAVWHFVNIQGNLCDASHGCGWQRALNIGQTAGFSQAEIENIVRGNF